MFESTTGTVFLTKTPDYCVCSTRRYEKLTEHSLLNLGPRIARLQQIAPRPFIQYLPAINDVRYGTLTMH